MAYYTRVLSKDEEFPAFEELALFVRTEHPEYRLTIEEGSEEEWESLLLVGTDEVEVALVERYEVYDGSAGQDEISDLIEDLYDVKPGERRGVAQELISKRCGRRFMRSSICRGWETEDGGNALHGLRARLWERGDAILQADNEGFTNEEGFHIVWQFSDSVFRAWEYGRLQGRYEQSTLKMRFGRSGASGGRF